MQPEPSSAAPAPAPEWTTPPMYAPVHPAPRPALILKLAGPLLGILIFVGALAFHMAVMLPQPTLYPPSNPAMVAYLNNVRILGVVAAVFMDLGVAFSVTLAWHIGTTKPEIAEGTRRGLLSFAGVFLAVWVVFSFFYYTYFGIFR